MAKQDRAEILNNSSSGCTNESVPELSMIRTMSESFNGNNNGMMGIERKDKDREEEKMRRATREEVAKSVREKFWITLQHRSEAMRKDHECLTMEALESMKDRYEDKISALR